MGPAYVQVFDNGSSPPTTAPGWGGMSFMGKYAKRAFHARRAEAIFTRLSKPHALVMRSLSMVCLDIDGKNGGFESAAALNLPVTLAETSKSGNGYHLFYTVEDTWNPTFGYDRLRDRIGWRNGIDVRATGCVYHYPSQRWNTAAPAPIPQGLLLDLEQARDDLAVRAATLTALRTSKDPDDTMEYLMIQESIRAKLGQPIPAGRRNNTLFAIGAEMKLAGIVGWSEQVEDRALELGLDNEEVDKLLKNIEKYGV